MPFVPPPPSAGSAAYVTLLLSIQWVTLKQYVAMPCGNVIRRAHDTVRHTGYTHLYAHVTDRKAGSW